jgi:hypothetical protein
MRDCAITRPALWAKQTYPNHAVCGTFIDFYRPRHQTSAMRQQAKLPMAAGSDHPEHSALSNRYSLENTESILRSHEKNLSICTRDSKSGKGTTTRSVNGRRDGWCPDFSNPRNLEVVYYTKATRQLVERGGTIPVHLKVIVAALTLGFFPSLLMSQAAPTATRVVDLQVGGVFSLANPGIASDATVRYGQMNFKGGGLYSTFDPTNHVGMEVSVGQVFGIEGVHERTYQIGPRFYMTHDRFQPYAKVLFGRGVFNFPNNMANEGFTIGALGGGLDYRFGYSVHFRADYEYQRWFGFGGKVDYFPGQLSPGVLSFGAAYHFGGGDGCTCER